MLADPKWRTVCRCHRAGADRSGMPHDHVDPGVGCSSRDECRTEIRRGDMVSESARQNGTISGSGQSELNDWAVISRAQPSSQDDATSASDRESGFWQS